MSFQTLPGMAGYGAMLDRTQLNSDLATADVGRQASLEATLRSSQTRDMDQQKLPGELEKQTLANIGQRNKNNSEAFDLQTKYELGQDFAKRDAQAKQHSQELENQGKQVHAVVQMGQEIDTVPVAERYKFIQDAFARIGVPASVAKGYEPLFRTNPQQATEVFKAFAKRSASAVTANQNSLEQSTLKNKYDKASAALAQKHAEQKAESDHQNKLEQDSSRISQQLMADGQLAHLKNLYDKHLEAVKAGNEKLVKKSTDNVSAEVIQEIVNLDPDSPRYKLLENTLRMVVATNKAVTPTMVQDPVTKAWVQTGSPDQLEILNKEIARQKEGKQKIDKGSSNTTVGDKAKLDAAKSAGWVITVKKP